MQSTSIFLCITTMNFNVTIFFIFQILIFNFFFKNITDFCIFLSFAFAFSALCLITSFFQKLIIFIACSLDNLQNVFIQALPLYTSWLFSMLLNEYILDIESLVKYVWLLLLQMNFQKQFYIHQSFLSYIQDLH